MEPIQVFKPEMFAFFFFKLFLFVLLFVIVSGILFGIFTYGRPVKQRRSESEFEAIFDAVIELVHLFIDRFRGVATTDKSWMNDQEILFSLRSMKPAEFEIFIAKMFSALGYQTMVTGGSYDGGIDIDMTKDGKDYVVQCKKFITRKVTPHDVRDFYGAMAGRRVSGRGFFITTNIFTLEAEHFAEDKQMELIDGNSLIQYVRRSGLWSELALTKKELPQVGQDGLCPKCGSILVLRTNRQNGDQFYGCSAYPKCSFTRPV